MSINSNATQSTQTARSSDNQTSTGSSIRTHFSLREILSNSAESIISEMTSKISRDTIPNNSSVRARTQINDLQNTKKFTKVNQNIHAFVESETLVNNRENAHNLFITLQTTRFKKQHQQVMNEIKSTILRFE